MFQRMQQKRFLTWHLVADTDCKPGFITVVRTLCNNYIVNVLIIDRARTVSSSVYVSSYSPTPLQLLQAYLLSFLARLFVGNK